MPSPWKTPLELRACDVAARFLKRIGAPRWMVRRGGLLNSHGLMQLRRARLRRWARKAMKGERSVCVVLGIRNRGGPRLENCLKSLRAQNYPQDLLSIVVVDCGSSSAERSTLKSLAKTYGVELLSFDANRWSRPRSLNIAIRRCRALITLYTDVDIIHSPNYLQAVVTHLTATPLRVCYSYVLDLPDEPTPALSIDGPIPFDELVRLKSLALQRISTQHLGLGVGATFTRFLQEIRGLDEAFFGWGSEDDDLNARLRALGLGRLKMSSDDVFYLHQFHTRSEPEGRADWHATLDDNRRLFEESVTTCRNGPDWGTGGVLPKI